MFSVRYDVRALAATFLIVGGAFATKANAQTGYTAFQPPQILRREFTAGMSMADNFHPFVFQWREGTDASTQLSVDAGLADVDRFGTSNTDFLIGGQYAHMVGTSTRDLPLDMLLTAGIFTEWGDNNSLISVPLGLSVGHRFAIEGSQVTITPWAHPRLALDICSDCPGADETNFNVTMDLGGNFQLTQRLAFRLSALMGDNDAMGFAVSWTPQNYPRR